MGVAVLEGYRLAPTFQAQAGAASQMQMPTQESRASDASPD